MASSGYEAGTVLPGIVGAGIVGEAAQRPVADPPNVLLVVLDATGYAQLGCYGSPIATPNIDALAAGGLLYTGMRTTASCPPSRSCILTGRNHHANAMPVLAGTGTGASRDARIPFENGFLSEMLLQRGYNTYMVGKWELTPAGEETAAGPYDRWPLGRGFERFYGFLGGATSPWYPELVYDNHQVPPPRAPEEGYHLTEDLADRAIGFIADAKQVAPDKPFLLHFCPGAPPAAHHVPRHWAERYRGRFDEGWDAYRERAFARQKERGIVAPEAEPPRRDPDAPEWDSLPAGTRVRAARAMEAVAGLLSHTDHQIGRLTGFLREIGEFDNTLIMVLSDNAAGPGAPQGTTGGDHDPWGWTFAGNTPLRRWRRDACRGGAAAPFVVHWPRGIAARGELRTQYAHLVDIVPTVLDALGVGPPTAIRGVTQAPLHGISFASTLHDAAAPARHRTQYFEMSGHRAIDHDQWRAVCPGPGPSLGALRSPITSAVLDDLHAHRWELYHLATDIAENHDLAGEHRDKLVELVAMWYVEARTYGVLPLGGGTAAVSENGARPAVTRG